jgi:hypothetical protein
MSRYPLALLFACAAAVMAQPVSIPATDPPAVQPASAQPRMVSPGTADLLRAALPKSAFVKPPEKKPDPNPPTLSETDKPPEEVLRLQKFVVREAQPPIFTERDLNTPQGLKAIAMRRYFPEMDRALNRFMLPLFAPISTKGTSNEVRAMTMYEDEERLKNMSEITDRTNMAMKSNAAAGAKMKNVERDTFMRWSDIGWQGGRGK